VRDDAGAGLEVGEQPGLELVHQVGQKVQRNDRGRAVICGKHISLAERDAFSHARLPCVGLAFRHQLGIDLDAESAGAVIARGGDHHPTVAGAEVHHQVIGTGTGESQHLVHRDLGGGQIGGRDVQSRARRGRKRASRRQQSNRR
jgi:hypothetical protein